MKRNLDIDLQAGVVPISRAASHLAALLKRAARMRQPIVVTQKGYPTGVILPVELFAALKALADGAGAPPAAEEAEAAEEEEALV